MGFSLSSLTDLTQKNYDDILIKSIVGSKFFETPGLVRMDGVNGIAVEVPTLTSSFEASYGCGAPTGGTDTIEAKTITLCKIGLKSKVCILDLLDKPTAQYVTSDDAMTADFESIFLAERIEKASALVSDLLWGVTNTGNTGTTIVDSNVSYSVCSNSILRQLTTNKATTAGAGITYTAITPTNAISVINTGLIANVPDAVRDNENLTLFLSPTEFDNVFMALVTANLYHFNPGEARPEVISWPYASLTIRKEGSLKEKSVQLLTPTDNIAVATRVENSFELPIVYSQDDYVFFSVKYRGGARVLFYELAVFAS